MRICIDLDGVIARLRRPSESYSDLLPVRDAVQALRTLKSQGHYLIVYTARHMKTCEGNVPKVVARQGWNTLDWLRRWEIEVDEICFGKPYADLYIDDCALHFSSWKQTLLRIGPIAADCASRQSAGLTPTSRLAPVLVLPMAGRGTRMIAGGSSSAGPALPKPLVDVCGRPMLWWALASLGQIPLSRIVFVILEDDDQMYDLARRAEAVVASIIQEGRFGSCPVEIVRQKGQPRGQLLSVLEARHALDPERGLIVASCDTLVSSSLGNDIADAPGAVAGIVSVIEAEGSNWSFAQVDDKGRVIAVAEKSRISNLASTGIYYFRSSAQFLSAADDVVTSARVVMGEFYIMPVYETMLRWGWEVTASRASGMWDMGNQGAAAAFSAQVRQSFLVGAGVVCEDLLADPA